MLMQRGPPRPRESSLVQDAREHAVERVRDLLDGKLPLVGTARDAEDLHRAEDAWIDREAVIVHLCKDRVEVHERAVLRDAQGVDLLDGAGLFPDHAACERIDRRRLRALGDTHA